MDDGAIIVQQGWLEFSSQSAKKGSGKNWLNRAVSKQWKKLFFILFKRGPDNDEIVLSGFEKSENVRYSVAKRTMILSPRYKIAKKLDFKNKEFVVEVNNESDVWYLAVDSQKMLDVWSIELQMQTRLSRSISGRIFSIVGAGTKPLQRIGGKDQQCLLYFTKWGLTLALQQSRAILAMWPLSTIRNYECTGTGQFCFESGRRSPMGVGKYVFFTTKGEDEVMFNVVDVFVNARLNAEAEIGRNKMEHKEATDDELLATYDKLHSCALGALPLDTASGVLSFDAASGYGTLDGTQRSKHSEPRSVISDRPPPYSRLDHLTLRPNEIDCASPLPLATPDFSTIMGADGEGAASRTDYFSSPNSDTAYDQLDRTQSWGSKSQASTYDHIERSSGNTADDSYDHIERTQTLRSTSSGKPSDDFSTVIPSTGELLSTQSHNFYVDHPKSNTNEAVSSDACYYPNAIYAPHLPINQAGLKDIARDKEINAVPDAGDTKSPVVDSYENSDASFGDIAVDDSQFAKSYENMSQLENRTQSDGNEDVIGLIDQMIAETLST